MYFCMAYRPRPRIDMPSNDYDYAFLLLARLHIWPGFASPVISLMGFLFAAIFFMSVCVTRLANASLHSFLHTFAAIDVIDTLNDLSAIVFWFRKRGNGVRACQLEQGVYNDWFVVHDLIETS